MNERQTTLLNALKSGKYLQTTGQLIVGEYCCVMGLACKLCPNVKIKGSVVSGEKQDSQFVLPDEVKKYFNFTNDGIFRLIEYNDTDHLSFNEIAALIEAKPKDFFLEDETDIPPIS